MEECSYVNLTETSVEHGLKRQNCRRAEFCGLHVTFGGRLDLYQQPEKIGDINKTTMYDKQGVNVGYIHLVSGSQYTT